MAEIFLINPRFGVSYWGLDHGLPLIGKKCNMPTACLPLLAALTPDEHRLTIVDENVEPIDYDRLAKADIVGLTGMIVQRHRMLEILRELKARGVFTVVGGPWVTVREDYFDGLADVIFVGEAETTWPQFLEEWSQGRHGHRYEQIEPTDMTHVPVPRYDLLKIKDYAFGSVQFSRGCPFQCEFCDIIVMFGRKPRLKTSAQVIAELEAMRKQHTRFAVIVDDNLIGNKVAMKKLLRDVAAWQAAEGYPVTFFAEASLNLSEDDELMELMVAANIHTVFIGIESPNEESLRETKKYQNVRKGGTIAERVRKIQDSGLEVWCGLIVGFDHDDARIFKAQYELMRQTDIVHAMAGMLVAIPKTPLYARLKKEGRLDLEEEQAFGEFGTNVIPLGMTREELRDGYMGLMQDLYDPEFYFERLENLYLTRQFDFARTRNAYWRRHPLRKWESQSVDALRAIGLFVRLMWYVPDPELRRIYRRRMMTMLRRRPDPNLLFIWVLNCVGHYHRYTMSRQMVEEQQPVNSY
jgi:radical SAM superfamily enzyme YgiQ (UPF0313 family)